MNDIPELKRVYEKNGFRWHEELEKFATVYLGKIYHMSERAGMVRFLPPEYLIEFGRASYAAMEQRIGEEVAPIGGFYFDGGTLYLTPSGKLYGTEGGELFRWGEEADQWENTIPILLEGDDPISLGLVNHP